MTGVARCRSCGCLTTDAAAACPGAVGQSPPCVCHRPTRDREIRRGLVAILTAVRAGDMAAALTVAGEIGVGETIVALSGVVLGLFEQLDEATGVDGLQWLGLHVAEAG